MTLYEANAGYPDARATCVKRRSPAPPYGGARRECNDPTKDRAINSESHLMATRLRFELMGAVG